jgi:uncharacterized iron-regulated protein
VVLDWDRGEGDHQNDWKRRIMKKVHAWGALLLCMLPTVTLSLAGETRNTKPGNIWIDVYQGEPVPYEDVLKDLATVRTIYLGERHTLQRHHEIQASILTDLARKGLPLALGLEQMESSQQSQLDRYNRGEINFEQLAEATAWPKRWQNYQQYRPILEVAHKWKASIVALNARSETIRQVVRGGGIDRLAPEARKELPASMLLQDPPYEKLLSLQMMVHAVATPQILRPMIEAQIARDEAMAQAISAFLKSDQGRGRKMLVLCGAGHVAYGFGLPTRVRQRLPDVTERIVVLSESGEVRLSVEEKAQSRDIEITHEQLRELRQPIADYLCVKPLGDRASAGDETDHGKHRGLPSAVSVKLVEPHGNHPTPLRREHGGKESCHGRDSGLTGYSLSDGAGWRWGSGEPASATANAIFWFRRGPMLVYM